ncbi:MAG: CapA family protein [Vicinamibacterales bacterium]
MSGSRRRFLKVAAASIGAPLGSGAQVGADSPAAVQASQPALRPAGAGEAVLTFGGDLFLTAPLADKLDAGSQRVFEVFRRSDKGVANLENGLSTVGAPELGGFRHGPSLRGAPALAAELPPMGVSAVSLANNHTGNYGREALLQTLTTLQAAGVAYAGAGRNTASAFEPLYMNVRGLTVAFLSVYSYYHNFGAADCASDTEAGIAWCRAFDVVVEPGVGFDVAQRDSPPYLLTVQPPSTQTIVAACREDLDRVKAAVHAARTRADFTILSVHFHWGRHGQHDVPPQQRAFAHELVDAGVDLLVGHGPHTIRGIERYRGRPIVYSMGNLVMQPRRSASREPAAAPRPPGREAFVARVTIDRQAVRALELLPIGIEGDGLPRFLPPPDGHGLLQKLNGLSAALGGYTMRLKESLADLEVTA